MACKSCGKEIPEEFSSFSFCPDCGAAVREGEHRESPIPVHHELQPRPDLATPITNDRSVRAKQTLAIMGAALLFIGVFLPIVSLPVVGSMNYFQNGQGDGTIILILAGISVLLALTRRFRGLWVSGLCSVAVLLFDLVDFMTRVSQTREQMQTQLANNPFRGLAEIAMNSVQVQWGWPVLMLGAVLIIIAAAMRSPSIRAPREPATGGFKAKRNGRLAVEVVLLVGLVLFQLARHMEISLPVKENSSPQGLSSRLTTSPAIQASPTPPDMNALSGPPHFSDGTHLVGQDVIAGTYRTRVASAGCYWERLAGFSGTPGDIIANESTDAPAIVTISPTDRGFQSHDCGTWTHDISAITATPTAFGDGTYMIGTDVQAGTYRNSGQQGCYYERLSGFGGTPDEIIANESTDSPAVVTILPSDKGFRSSRCGNWTLVSGAEPSPPNETSSTPTYQAPSAEVIAPPSGTSQVQTGSSQYSPSSYAAQLRSVVLSRGYEPIGDTSSVVADSEGDRLFIQRAACDNVPDGHCQKLFISFNERFLGTDTYLPSWTVHNVAQEGVGSFSAVYEDLSDPNRNLSPVKVVYTWDGQKLTGAGTPPTRPRVSSK